MTSPALLIREVTSADRAALAFSFHHLAERSRHQRFFTAAPQLRPGDLDRMSPSITGTARR